MLASTSTSIPAIETGARTASITRSANRMTSLLSPTELLSRSQTMANSSPPIRDERVVLADDILQSIGDFAEHLVAGRVTVNVVDRLEPIEVDQTERQSSC